MSIRSITLNDVSTDTLGIWVSEADYGELNVQQQFETLPFKNGYYNFCRMGGQQYYEPRKLTYTFAMQADTPDQLATKIRQVRTWLYSIGTGYLLDGYFAGWRFTNVQCISIDTPDYKNDARTHATIRAEFLCDPQMESTDGVRDQIITLAGKNVTAHILKNAVLCTAYTNYGASDMTVSISGTTMTLTKSIDAQYAGLRCFEIAGEVSFTLTGGYIGSRAVTLAGALHGYVDIPSGGGTLTLTAELEEEPSSTPYIVGTFAAGIAFTHDAQKKYRFDDYAVGTHTLTVNGTTKPFTGFTIEGVYDTLDIVGARETDVYKLWYDSVEVSL